MPAVVAVTAAALISQALPALHLDVSSLPAHVAIETAFGLASLFAAGLIGARCGRAASVADLLAIGGLAVGGLTSLTAFVGPASAGLAPSAAVAWLPMPGRLLGAALLAAAAFAPTAPRPAAPRVFTVVAAVVAAVAAATAAGLALGAAVPITHAAAEQPLALRDATSALLVTVQLLGLGATALAAWGFYRRAVRPSDERPGGDAFLLALAGGCWCAALSRLGFAHGSSLYAETVRNGDLLRLASALAILGAAAVELRSHQRRLVELAAAGERRRMARELHDGLAQELAFIVSHTRVLARRGGDADSIAMLGSAADRAFDASRAAIQELRAVPEDGLAERLAAHAREVARRAGVPFEAGPLEPLELPAERQRAAIHLVREAATNVVRHADASCMRFAVERVGDELRVVIADDGRGFDPSGTEHRNAPGFGRLSMADRAEELGGRLAILSAPGAGTRVELVLPAPGAAAPAPLRTRRELRRAAVRAARSAA